MSEVKRFITPMRGRDPDEAHRAATSLELFFDLVMAWSWAGCWRPSW